MGLDDLISILERLNKDKGGRGADWVLALKLQVPEKNHLSKSALSYSQFFPIMGEGNQLQDPLRLDIIKRLDKLHNNYWFLDPFNETTRKVS